MTEFSLIEKYCKGIGATQAQTTLGVGDDAAVLTIEDGYQLVVSVDTMVQGVHFDQSAIAQSLGHKLLAVNLSDIAAMGAIPKWATIALTLPSQDEKWLADFSTSLDAIAKQYNVELVGGDTTKGPLTLTLQIIGLVEEGKALVRSGAKVGDDVYVSHVIGDAALALANGEGETDATLLHALHTPIPRVELGRALRSIASSCIDISDGLVADCKHIADQSSVSIEIDVESVPVSKPYQEYMEQGGTYDLALSGGDDYELAFTAQASERDKVKRVSEKFNIRLSRIGLVVASEGENKVSLLQNGKEYKLTGMSGYDHFGKY